MSQNNVVNFRDEYERVRKLTDATSAMPLEFGGRGGDSGGMEPRVSHLETRMDRVETKLDTIIQMLGGKASKQDVWTALGTGAAIAVAIVALFIGVLTYLQDQRIATRPETPAAVTSAPQSIIIQLPAQLPSAVTPAPQ